MSKRIYYNLDRKDRCGYCFSNTHLTATCSTMARHAEEGRKTAVAYKKRLEGITTRLCGYCSSEEHSSTKCSKRFHDSRDRTLALTSQVNDLFSWLFEIGFGPGAALTTKKNSKKKEMVIVISDFRDNALHYFISAAFAKKEKTNKSSYLPISAVSLENERVRDAILPFNADYSFSKYATNVEVLQRASEEEIANLKSQALKVLNCHEALLNYNDAESFFNAGYRFAAGTSNHARIDESLVKANKKSGS